MTTNVALLPEKWRAEAEQLAFKPGSMGSARLRQCAAELAAALAHRQDGELLALADRIDFAATHAQNNGGNMSWKYARDFAHELRTLAASPRGVEVTDEMVEAGAKGLCVWSWDSATEKVKDECRWSARRALTAALSQPSELSKSQVKRIALERGESPGLADSGEVG